MLDTVALLQVHYLFYTVSSFLGNLCKDNNALAHVMMSSAIERNRGNLTYQEMFDSDLKIVRLLLEIGRIEQIRGLGLLRSLAYQCEKSRIPPVLEYLWKQEYFEFGLSDIFDTSDRMLLTWWVTTADLSSVLRSLCVCVGDIGLSFNAGGESLVVETVSKFLRERIKPDEQREWFNEAVIIFCLLLSHGFHPSTKVRVDDQEVTVTRLTHVDPEFTGVAWRLALKLHGWILPPQPKSVTYNRTPKLQAHYRRVKLRWSGDETDDEGNDSRIPQSKKKSAQPVSTDLPHDIVSREE